MKTLYEFTINKNVEKEVEAVAVGADGKEVKGLKLVTEEVPVKIAIKKPTRQMADDSSLFYSVKLSEATKAGVLSHALFRKRLASDGGSLTEKEQKEFGDLYTAYFDKQSQITNLNSKKSEELTNEEKSQKETLTIEIGNLVQKISNFENVNSQLFENTSESYANRHRLRWWILNLIYIQKIDVKGNLLTDLEPLFNAPDYDKKLDIYDKKEEEADGFYVKVIRKAAFLINYWYGNQANTEEDFIKLAKEFDSDYNEVS